MVPICPNQHDQFSLSSPDMTLPKNNIGLQPCYCFRWLTVRSQRTFKSCVLKQICSVDLYGPKI